MNLKKIISVLIILILTALAILYLRNNLHEFRQLEIVSPHFIIPIIILFLINYLLISIVTKELLKPLGVNLTHGESYQLSMLTGFYNLITPFRGGMAARAVYLKKKHEFSYTNFLATLAASYVLIFFVSSGIGLIAMWLVWGETGTFNGLIALILGATFLGMLGVIVFAPRFNERKNKWLNGVINVINGWHLIKNNKRVIITTAVVSAVQLGISSLMLYLQFRVFGLEVPFVQTLLLSAISALGIVIAVTPAGLGINEAITVFFAAVIGITPVESLSAALLGRLVSVVVLFILGPIFSYTLIRRKNGN